VRPNVRREPALDLVAQVIAETYSDQQEKPTKALTHWLHWRSGARAFVRRGGVHRLPPVTAREQAETRDERFACAKR
jgi:hypothetical protein